jgi:hypothetical protein
MKDDRFSRDLRNMLEARSSGGIGSMHLDVADVVRRTSPGKFAGLISALRFGGTVATTALTVTILLGALVLARAGGGDAGSAGSPSPSGFLICGQAIAAAKVGHSGSTAIFTDPSTGQTENVVWPQGFSTTVLDGRAQLTSRNGQVIGNEGDVLTLGGGAIRGAFAVCSVNGVTYALP